ncbi:radical SAM protein [Mesorhizobium sp. M0040]|uniref:radical SAM/SPASM domain-containing protein n=1 Tax=Mesorhizobium sp. M0040 TaxID=2956855 RepID=UPI003339C6B0
MALAPSRYNFVVHDDGASTALFNTLTGGLMVLEGRDAIELGAVLLQPGLRLSGDEFSPDLLSRLRSGGYLVAQANDEITEIRERFWRARGEAPVVITITTTMDCNLACYYCYEERSASRLKTDDVNSLVTLALERVAASRRPALHVDWYGGEPLLNPEFIETASMALQEACAANGITYVASIISNGSLWPDDVEKFIARHRVRQVQISFDGLKAHHDKRRRYRRLHRQKEEGEELSSFERAVALVDRLVKCVRVDVRYNTDRENLEDMLPFLDFARDRGWFDADFPAVFQPARLAAYSHSSSFMRRLELTIAEFDDAREKVRKKLSGVAAVEESEIPDGFPYPKTSVCAALANHSAVLGAEGSIYRCGLQVGEQGRAVGSLHNKNVSPSVQPVDRPQRPNDSEWWQSFDPTKQPTCSSCSFLPICWGGCPKKHLEQDQHALREQGRYWRSNLPRLIAKAAGFASPPALAEFSESLQFRTSNDSVDGRHC